MTRRAGKHLNWRDPASLQSIIAHPERATPAAIKAIAMRLFEQGVDTPHSHDLPAGLHVHIRPANLSEARAVSSWEVVATAVHSRSRGWIPHVMLNVVHHPVSARGDDDDKQTISLLVPSEMLEHLMQNANEAAQRSFLDAMTGPVEE